MAMGVTVDFEANLTRFTSAIDKATNDLNRFQSNASRVGTNIGKTFAGLGIGLSAAGFIGMIKGSIDAADRLRDLSKTTDIAVEQLAGLRLASQQSGGDLESVAASISKLSVNIGKNSEKFAKLGITAKDPLEAFKQLTDVFVSIQDPQLRAAVAAEALGKSWQGAAPLLAEGGKAIGEMVAKGTRLSGITKEMADNADRFNDQLAELKTISGSLTTKLAGEMLPALSDIALAMKQAYEEGGKLQAVIAAIGGLGAFLFTDQFSSTKVKIENLKKQIDDLETAQKNFTGPSYLQKVLIGSDEEIAAKIATAKAEIKGLQDSLNKPPEKKATPPVTDPKAKKNAEDFIGDKKDKDPLAAFIEQTRKVREEEFNKLFKETINRANLSNQQRDEIIKSLAEKQFAPEIKAESDRVEEQNKIIKENIEFFEKHAESVAKDAEHIRNLIDPTRELYAEMEKVNDLVRNGNLTEAEGSLRNDQILREIDDINTKIKEGSKTLDEMDEFSKNAAKGIQEAFADFLFDPFQNGVEGMLRSFGNMLKRMAAEAIAAELARKLFGDLSKGGDLGGLLGAAFKSFSGGGTNFGSGDALNIEGGMASGGPVSAGKLYEVGEGNKAEMFMSGGKQYLIPGNDGAVIPNSKLDAGGKTIIFNHSPTYNVQTGVDQAQSLNTMQKVSQQEVADFESRLRRQGVI